MAVKSTYADFRVEEVLTETWQRCLRPSAARFALYRVTKSGLSTPEVVGRVAAALKVPTCVVRAAGLKDKHGKTTQHLTVQIGCGARARLWGQGWHAERLGWCEAPLEAAAIEVNRFTIRVRGLSAARSAALDKAAQRLLLGEGSLQVTNYFGPQRFGSARAGGFAARHLIRGEFEQALRLAMAAPYRHDPPREKRLKQMVAKQWGAWGALAAKLSAQPLRRPLGYLAKHEGDFAGAFAALPYLYRKMSVEAYQSLLWNLTASAFLRQVMAADQLLTVRERYGDWLFAQAPVPDELAGARLPLLTPDTALVGPWADAARGVLREEGVTLKQLARLKMAGVGLTGGERPLFVVARDFRLSRPQAHKSSGGATVFRDISFSLPRGAYATVVLRALGQ